MSRDTLDRALKARDALKLATDEANAAIAAMIDEVAPLLPMRPYDDGDCLLEDMPG